MPTFKIEAGPDDLMCLIGMMSLGLDPVATVSIEQTAEYTTLGRQFAETVFTQRKYNETVAVLAATQQRMVSALQVVVPPAAEAEAEPETVDAGG